VDLHQLGIVEPGEISRVPNGRDQQVPGRVRELVQECERPRAPRDHEPFLVGALDRVAEEAAALCIGVSDVLEPPGCPELLRHRDETG
jgi:hypothetical protein